MSSRIPCHLLVGSILFLAAVSLPADAGERSREARLVPPAGAPAPEARGQVSIGPEDLALTAEGLEPGEYAVLFEDGTGARTTLGILSMGDDRDGSTGGKPWGKLELDASALQSAEIRPLELAGRPLWVAREDGTVVLAGRAPLPITEEQRAARCAILRPDAAPDPDAEGVLKLESGGGRVALKVHLKRLLPRTSYSVAFLEAAGGAAESLGLVTTDPDGKGQLKLDSSHGDPIPFGAGDLVALVGLEIEVRESDGGRLVLAGAVCEPAVLDIETDDDDREEVKGCTIALEVPDAAPIANAEGETVIEVAGDEGAELEVEIVIDIPGAAYEVTLTDPAPRGTTVSLGTAVTDCRGEAEVEVKDADGSAIPFGKRSVLELGGFLVSVKDESGALVLHGVVPDLDCADGKGVDAGEDEEADDDDDEVIIIEGCSAGAVPDNLIDGPLFAMIGEHDAPFHRGDVNEDLGVNISDAVATLLYMLKGGARPRCLDAADFNDDGSLDLTDPILELRHLFLGDGMARSPGTLIKGSDPTPDGLYCEE